MVIKEKTASAALSRYRLGTVMVWVGVLTWVPFMLLRIAGEKPSLLWFLPIHLAGVMGGSRLRSVARKEMGVDPPRRNLLARAGHAMSFLGILVWAPYFYLKVIAHQPADVSHFLPYHLTGILGGAALMLLGYLRDRTKASAENNARFSRMGREEHAEEEPVVSLRTVE